MMSASIRLFVGNLSDKVNENELRSAFCKFGEVTALDVKNKQSVENDKKIFAFITLSATNYNIDSCIQHFTNRDVNGTRLYVTRARESFLDRLQREREQTQRKQAEKNEHTINKVDIKPLNINVNPHKRKFDTNNVLQENGNEKRFKNKFEKQRQISITEPQLGDSLPTLSDKHFGGSSTNSGKDDKKQNSDWKRLESMKKKRQEFNEKKMIIKTGLIGIDKVANKKVIFSDDNEIDKKATNQNGLPTNNNEFIDEHNNKRTAKLFDEQDDSDSEVNFEIKPQFEGKKGQKVLDLQSRYKADKRFVLDERFIEDDKTEETLNQPDNNEVVELGQVDEKYKQLNILQDVLGVPIKMKQTQDTSKQTKSKIGMLRFDPNQPEHAKFLAPVITKQEPPKKLKKKKSMETPDDEDCQEEQKIIEKVEVSKEQFYKVADTLKETLEQPTSFSLRRLFAKEEVNNPTEEDSEHVYEHNIKVAKEKKVKHPLDPGEKNPFVYDSSDSENEEGNVNENQMSKVEQEPAQQISVPKPVWRENLFFSECDDRLKDGLLYFTQSYEVNAHKDRRQLKSVMKKRVYNKERKNQMFQKKIGGRRKTTKKNFRKKS